MKEVIVHIERLVVEGHGVASLEPGALRIALVSALEGALGSHLAGSRPTGTAAYPQAAAIARLDAPAIGASGDGASLGQHAGGALASVVGPLCLPRGAGGSRGGRG